MMNNRMPAVTEKNLVKKYPLLVFVALAYGLFLLSLLVIGFLVQAAAPSPFALNWLVAAASWMPNLAAFVVLWMVRTPGGVRNLTAGWLKWRLHPGWYLFGILPLLISLAIAGLSITLGSPLVSVVVLGLLIAGWHSILHLAQPSGAPEWQFWLTLVCYSVVVTWGYLRTGGSLLIVSLFHFSFNFGLNLVMNGLGWISVENLFRGYTIVYLLWALGILLLAGKAFRQKPAFGE